MAGLLIVAAVFVALIPSLSRADDTTPQRTGPQAYVGLYGGIGFPYPTTPRTDGPEFAVAMEYAIAIGAPSHPSLKPLSELDPPTVNLSNLNAPLVIQLMQQAGLL